MTVINSFARKLLDYVHEGSEMTSEQYEVDPKTRVAFEHGFYLGVRLTILYILGKLEYVKDGLEELDGYLFELLNDIAGKEVNE